MCVYLYARWFTADKIALSVEDVCRCCKRVGTAHTTKTIKDEKIMATLRDLCKDVPQAIDRKAVEYELLRRKNASYLKRMGELRAEEHVFDRCKQTRPCKGKTKNRFSREEAGTKGRITMGVRTGKYGVVVCSCVNKW